MTFPVWPSDKANEGSQICLTTAKKGLKKDKHLSFTERPHCLMTGVGSTYGCRLRTICISPYVHLKQYYLIQILYMQWGL